MIKEIIFDCFGVLTEDGWLAFLGRYATKETEDELGLINHQYDRGQVSFKEFVAEVAAITGVDQAIVHKMVGTAIHPNYRLLEYIKELRTRGFSIGLLSNVGVSLSSILPHEFIEQFDTITLSYEVGAIKPEPAIFEAHLSKTGNLPEETVFVDDREVNCVGAKALGIQAVWYRNFNDARKSIEVFLA